MKLLYHCIFVKKLPEECIWLFSVQNWGVQGVICLKSATKREKINQSIQMISFPIVFLCDFWLCFLVVEQKIIKCAKLERVLMAHVVNLCDSPPQNTGVQLTTYQYFVLSVNYTFSFCTLFPN